MRSGADTELPTQAKGRQFRRGVCPLVADRIPQFEMQAPGTLFRVLGEVQQRHPFALLLAPAREMGDCGDVLSARRGELREDRGRPGHGVGSVDVHFDRGGAARGVDRAGLHRSACHCRRHIIPFAGLRHACGPPASFQLRRAEGEHVASFVLGMQGQLPVTFACIARQCDRRFPYAVLRRSFECRGSRVRLGAVAQGRAHGGDGARTVEQFRVDAHGAGVSEGVKGFRRHRQAGELRARSFGFARLFHAVGLARREEIARRQEGGVAGAIDGA